MRVLVIGSGGREHALCWALRRSSLLRVLYCAPGNGGTSALAENVPLNPMDFAACADWAERQAIDLTVIGPDDPLAGGIADVFAARGLRVFGPHAAAARIESSKTWAKRLLLSAGIPTAQSAHFTSRDAAETYLRQREAHDAAYPVVIKADGLAAGKGVTIASDGTEARTALDALLVRGQLGAAGSTVLIEEYLRGREVSLFALCDGTRALPMVPACDYKAAYDGDTGPNTGGMGAFSPPRFVTPALLAEVEGRILRPTLAALAAAGAPFRGLLYAGLMLTETGPHVLEFNARFGDPETQVLLPRLQSDLLTLLVAAADGRLDEVPPLVWDERATCGVVLATAEYPIAATPGLLIEGLETLDADVLAFHAGTRLAEDGRLLTAGGRVLTLVASGTDVAAARAQVYANIGRVRFDGARWRSDIGAREVQSAG